MFYTGKYIDTFEPAFQQMLAFHGMSAAAHIDCIGKRCFGFLMGESVKDWFRPAVSVKEAAAEISEKTGMELSVAGEERSIQDKMEILRSGAVAGPVWTEAVMPEIRHVYYRGDAHYLFISSGKEEEYCISDPEGFPRIPADSTLIETILRRDRPSVLYLKKRTSADRTEPDLRKVMEEGVAFHSRLAGGMEMVRDSVCRYEDTVYNRLALQYGLMNYVLQMDKVFRLAVVCGFLDGRVVPHYQKLIGRIYQTGENQKIQELPEIMREIWTLL